MVHPVAGYTDFRLHIGVLYFQNAMHFHGTRVNVISFRVARLAAD
jgi:hypothetical protein